MDFAERVTKLVPEGAYYMLDKAQALEASGREIIHLEMAADAHTFETSPGWIKAIQENCLPLRRAFIAAQGNCCRCRTSGVSI
jgi:hypothetical protein